MTKRPALDVTAPKFGEWLKELRGKRSLEQIAIHVRPLVAASGQKVNRASLHQFEQGRVPNWPVLAALARFYEKDLQAVLLRLAQSLEFPGSSDLIGHEGTLQSPPQPQGSLGGGDGKQLQDRIDQLEGKVIAYEAIIRHAHQLGVELVSATATNRPQGGKSARKKA